MNGTHNGQPLYQAGMKQKWVWFDTVTGGYVISDVVGTIGDYAWSQDTPTTNPDGPYHVTGSHCEGAPVVGPITTPGIHGLIALWSGSIASIPTGWVLCDGTHETPDLRDKFIVGAGNTYPVNNSGGALLHTHNVTLVGSATLPASVVIKNNAPNGNYAPSLSVSVTGTTNQGGTLPPYYALAYIMHL